MSMAEAPPSKFVNPKDMFCPWLVEHPVEPGKYRDPVQLLPINFRAFVEDPRLVQSGHLDPLDRGGRHVPTNTFLMLARSNQIQGNMKVAELLELMQAIVKGHEELKRQGNKLEELIQE
jgi:hypothetical protein